MFLELFERFTSEGQKTIRREETRGIHTDYGKLTVILTDPDAFGATSFVQFKRGNDVWIFTA